MHSAYFAAYAVVATIVLITIAWAQYEVSKREGTSMNTPLIRFSTGMTAFLWAGTFATEWAYYMTGDGALALSLV